MLSYFLVVRVFLYFILMVCFRVGICCLANQGDFRCIQSIYTAAFSSNSIKSIIFSLLTGSQSVGRAPTRWNDVLVKVAGTPLMRMAQNRCVWRTLPPYVY